MIGRLVSYIIGSMVAVLALGTLLGDRYVTYDDEVSVLVFAAVLGVLSAFVKPVLQVLTLPLTCLTFGLFALVLNALLFGLAAAVTPGVEVTIGGAVIGAIMASVASGIVFSVVDEE